MFSGKAAYHNVAGNLIPIGKDYNEVRQNPSSVPSSGQR